MRITLLTLVAVMASLSISAQQTIKSNNVDAFNTIVLNGNMTAELIPAEVASIEIELLDTNIDRLRWSVDNNTMSVTLRPPQIGRGHADVKIYYVDTLELVTVSGSTLNVPGKLTGGQLKIEATGGAKLTMSIECLDLDLVVTGNSVAKLGGQAKYISLRASERSRVDIRELAATSVEVDAATGAEAFVNVSERLVANAKSAATVFYMGAPAIVKDRTSKINNSVGGVIPIGLQK